MVSLDKRYKSVLFEYCQKKKINRPSFSTLPAEGDVSGFQSEVTIEGTAFGPGGVFSKKKQAENDASRVCLISLGLLKKPEEEGKGEELVKLAPQQTESTSGVQETPTEAEQRSEAVVQEESDTKQALPVPAESANLVISSSPVAVPNQPSNGVSSTSAFGYNDQSPVHSVLTKRPKSILQEFCQKSKMSLPVYDTQASYQGNRISGYTCVLTLNDVTYPSDSIYPNKRDAEHSAAAKALASLDPINIMHSPYSIRSQGPLPSPPLSSPTFSTHSVSYKNLLQEHMQQRSLESPIYDTKTKGRIFQIL